MVAFMVDNFDNILVFLFFLRFDMQDYIYLMV